MNNNPVAQGGHSRSWFHPMSALVMIVCDFSGFAGDLFGSFFLLVMTITIVVIFFVTMAAVFFIQRVMDGDATRVALLKGVIAGALCAFPMPIFGTVAGGVILVKSGLGNGKLSVLKKRNQLMSGEDRG